MPGSECRGLFRLDHELHCWFHGQVMVGLLRYGRVNDNLRVCRWLASIVIDYLPSHFECLIPIYVRLTCFSPQDVFPDKG